MAKVRASENEIKRAQCEVKRLFEDKDNMPLSFKIGDKVYKGIGTDFIKQSEESCIKQDRCVYKYTAIHTSGIEVSIDVTAYTAYAAIEWVIWFRNKSGNISPVISDIKAADMCFSGRDAYLEYFIGDDNEDRYALKPEGIELRPGISLSFKPMNGRPTSFQMPFYRLYTGDTGLVISVGWSGQWKSVFDTVNIRDNVRFSCGQAEIQTYLKPDEEIRTPLVSMLLFDGRDTDRVINLWRRWLIDCNVRKMEPKYAASTSWLYGEMKDATEENQIAAYEAYRTHGITLNYWWMDAGWYYKKEGEHISSWIETGSWSVDRDRFPTGFKAITEHVGKYGSKTLLWFEPERVTPGTYIYEHPEWCLDMALADMGNREFRTWLFERVSSVIDKGGISIYRQDFNIDPEYFWHWGDINREGENRTGITENKYVVGYLQYWDMLIERYPDMMLDSCASGGRRNDLETMRRSVSLHKTDADYSDYARKQSMHYSFYQWLPYFGTPVTAGGESNKVDKYSLRTGFIPWFTYNYDIRFPESVDFTVLAEQLATWKDTNMYFGDDYYTLTDWNMDLKSWIGWEFYDGDKNEGILQLYRRELSTDKEKLFKLKGLEPDTVYELISYDTDVVFDNVCVTRRSGKELLNEGLTVHVEYPRTGAIIKFKAVSV